jgi:molybdate transport system substrate-binding protein
VGFLAAAKQKPDSPQAVSIDLNPLGARMIRLATLFLLLFAANSLVHSADITVLSGGAIEPGLHSAAAAFEKQSGHHVKITFNTTPQITKRMAAGERFDVVIAPPAAIEGFSKEGKIDNERVNVGRVGLGVAVRPGAPVPDIASADSLKRSILQADSIGLNLASPGIYFENLLKKWGVYEQLESKTTRYADGASVMEHALKGKGNEIAIGAITEILLDTQKGLRFIGPVPAEVQNYTSYIAAPMSGGGNAEISRSFVQFLGSPAGKKLFVAAGIE